MSEVNTQIYSGMWVRLPHEVKKVIVAKFNIERNGASHVVDGTVQTDGYLDRDLAVLNVENLQKELDSKEPDLFVLWNSFIKKVQAELNPPKAEVKEEKPNVEMNIKIDGEEVKLSGITKKRNAKKA